MKIDQAKIIIRPRSTYEAIDLGVALWRQHALLLIRSSLTLLIPTYLILLAIFWNYPVFIFIIMWWLKPLLDRLPLHTLSVALFAPAPNASASLKYWFKNFRHHLINDLLLRRLSPMRSYLMPIYQLERSDRKSAKARRKYLSAKGYEGNTLIFVFMALEALLTLGVLFFMDLMIPVEITHHSNFMPTFELTFFADEMLFFRFMPIAYLLVLSVTETLYASIGFSLYINRRIISEGWDLELGFKKLAQRLGKVALFALVCLLPFAGTTQYLHASNDSNALNALNEKNSAQIFESSNIPKPIDHHHNAETAESDTTTFNTENIAGKSAPLEIEKLKNRFAKLIPTSEKQETLPIDPALLKQQQAEKVRVQNILDQPPFLIITEHKRFITEDDETESTPQTVDFKGTDILQLLLFLIVAILVGFLLYYARTLLPLFKGAKSPKAVEAITPIAEFQGHAITPDKVPHNMLTSFNEQWQDSPREALALLYRTMLSHLVHHYKIPLKRSHTENEVLKLVKKLKTPTLTESATTITRAWQRVAYAHQSLSESDQQTLLQAWERFQQTHDHHASVSKTKALNPSNTKSPQGEA